METKVAVESVNVFIIKSDDYIVSILEGLLSCKFYNYDQVVFT